MSGRDHGAQTVSLTIEAIALIREYHWDW